MEEIPSKKQKNPGLTENECNCFKSDCEKCFDYKKEVLGKDVNESSDLVGIGENLETKYELSGKDGELK